MEAYRGQGKAMEATGLGVEFQLVSRGADRGA